MCVCSLSHLTGGVRADELIVDLLGFDRQFGCRFGVPVIFTGKVERNVLFRELRHQEGGEGTQATCRGGGRGGGGNRLFRVHNGGTGCWTVHPQLKYFSTHVCLTRVFQTTASIEDIPPGSG